MLPPHGRAGLAPASRRGGAGTGRSLGAAERGERRPDRQPRRASGQPFPARRATAVKGRPTILVRAYLMYFRR